MKLLPSKQIKASLKIKEERVTVHNQKVAEEGAKLLIDLNTLRLKFKEETENLTSQYQKYGEYLELEKINLEEEIRGLESVRVKALAPLLLKKEDLDKRELLVSEQEKKALENLQDSIRQKREANENIIKADKILSLTERKLDGAKNEENRIFNLQHDIKKDSSDLDRKREDFNLYTRELTEFIEKEKLTNKADREAIEKEKLTIAENKKDQTIKQQQLELREQSLKRNFDLAREKGIL